MKTARQQKLSSGAAGHAPKKPQTWATTDQDELALRRLRAEAEPMIVRPITPGETVFGDYSVRAASPPDARLYVVELRSLQARVNYCTCPDFRKNFLGTCKHIEKTLLAVGRGAARDARSPFVEVFQGRAPEDAPRIQLPADVTPEETRFLRTYVTVLGAFNPPWETTLQVFLRDLEAAPPELRARVRVSRELQAAAAEAERRARLRLAREQYEAASREGGRTLDLLRHPLYDYQTAGMLHLAFTGRAMLADEMGLGKTVQAIGACQLLRSLHGIRRALVVCPTSLKAEWEDQIRKFTDLPVCLVYGGRGARLKTYRETTAFFVMVNYEQVLRDEAELSELLRPDVVILDEAQRIKNWQTRTAQTIKRLSSPYAFVLTGTPLENRIDEVYSLVEFIDPRIFGSLFRFNREFYQFDDRGRICGFQNLRALHERLQPIMLRRRKDEIAEQLPERMDNNYFVPLTPEQQKRYSDYNLRAMPLLAAAQRRPLTEPEMKKLQMLLACMRMICDTVYILDAQVTDSPKVDELLKVLDDLWQNEPERKVLIFSEWERMLELVRRRLTAAGFGFAWHTGVVPQQERYEEVKRFKEDPACRIFLSTESGGLGLNLQVASVVINLDLPWNPARLEQRIARAWRKHQKNAVNVINLVAENTLEHRMLGTLAAKQALADGVLDARGDLDNMELPSGRAAFLRRLEQVLQTQLAPAAPAAGAVEAPAVPALAPALPPVELLAQELAATAPSGLQLCRAKVDETGVLRSAFVVLRQDEEAARGQVAELLRKVQAADAAPELHVMDQKTFALLDQLAKAGLITIHAEGYRELYRTDNFGPPPPKPNERRRQLAEPALAQAERQRKMATLLAGGGFPLEAVAPMGVAVDHAALALLALLATDPPAELPAHFAPALLPALSGEAGLKPELAAFLATASAFQAADEAAAQAYLQQGQALVQEAQERLLRLAL